MVEIDLSKLKRHSFRKIRWIYYLFDKWELVYIWQSDSIIPRINVHTRDKKFDSYSYIEIVDWIWMDDIEMSEIIKYKPKYNKYIQDEVRSKWKMTVMFNLIRRLWYKLPNLNEKIRLMSDEDLIKFIVEKSGISKQTAEDIVHMNTKTINERRERIWHK